MEQKKTIEYHVGGTVFSLIGALFILIALVFLGINYLEKFYAQLMMYAVGLVVILLSETLVKRLSVSLANVISSIGLGGLFIATFVNDTIKDIYFGMVALVIGAIISIVGIFYGKVKNAIVLRITSLIGFYAIFLVCGQVTSELKLMLICVLMLLVNLLGIFFKNKDYNQIYIPINVMFAFAYSIFFLLSCNKWDIQPMFELFGIICMFIVMTIAFVISDRRAELASTIFALIFTAFMVIFICANIIALSNSKFPTMYITVGKISVFILSFAVLLIAFLTCTPNKIFRYFPIYYMFLLALGISAQGDAIEDLIVIALTVLAARFLGRQKQLAYADCVVYGLGGIMLMMNDFSSEWYAALITSAVLIAGMFIFKHFYVYNEIAAVVLIPISLSLLWSSTIGELYTESLTIGILFFFSGLLLIFFLCAFKFKDRDQLGVVITGMIIQMLLYGVFVIMSFDDVDFPMVNTIFFMATAVIYIIYGFIKDRKYMRVIGLVAAGMICLKLLIWDMRDVSAIIRIVTFMGVGVLALIISMLYARLDKKNQS